MQNSSRSRPARAARSYHGAQAHGGGEAELLLADAGSDRAVDLLEVDVPDPVRVVRDQLEVVRAAVGDVAGVEAQLHRLRVRAVEEALDLRLGAHVAVGVGVEDEDGAVRFGDVPAELGHAGGEAGPLVVGERGRGDDVAVEVRVALGQDHEVLRAVGTDDGHLGVAVGLGLLEGVLALVQGDEHRAAGERQPALRIRLADDPRVRGQVAEGAELAVPVARRLDLVEVALPGSLERVQAGVPHAPGIGRGAEEELGIVDAGGHDEGLLVRGAPGLTRAVRG